MMLTTHTLNKLIREELNEIFGFGKKKAEEEPEGRRAPDPRWGDAPEWILSSMDPLIDVIEGGVEEIVKDQEAKELWWQSILPGIHRTLLKILASNQKDLEGLRGQLDDYLIPVKSWDAQLFQRGMKTLQDLSIQQGTDAHKELFSAVVNAAKIARLDLTDLIPDPPRASKKDAPEKEAEEEEPAEAEAEEEPAEPEAEEEKIELELGPDEPEAEEEKIELELGPEEEEISPTRTPSGEEAEQFIQKQLGGLRGAKIPLSNIRDFTASNNIDDDTAREIIKLVRSKGYKLAESEIRVLMEGIYQETQELGRWKVLSGIK